MARGVRGARMHKQWNSVGTNVIHAVSADITSVVAGSTTDDSPFTVLRVIGEVMFGPGAVNVIDDAAAITFALGVLPTDVVAGNANLPDPEDEPDYPWLWWSIHFFAQSVAMQETGGDPRMAARIPFDVRSMRKVKSRESLVWVFQYRDINGAPTVDIVPGKARVLMAI